MSTNDQGETLNLQDRYNALFQRLNRVKKGDNAAPMTEKELQDERLELKTLAHRIKRDVIDKDYPLGTKWSAMSAQDKEFYQLLLEARADDERDLQIYKCVNMWCAKNTLGEVCKTKNYTARQKNKKREEKVRYKASIEVK